MGECSINSEIFDSLDYLIPPVNKSQKTLRCDLLFGGDYQKQTDVKLIKDFPTNIKRIASPSNSCESELHPSLVSLKKGTEELIYEQYSNLNLNNTNKYLEVTKEYRNYLGKNKPMIEVTVIPKVAGTQTSKVFNKRCDKTKKLQSTVSNQENSIKRQNIYFTVKGKRHEKVYELKTTESTNLSKFVNTKYEDISIQQISNSKRLITSLNMEKNKRKNKKNIKINNKDKIFDCSCNNSKNDNVIENLNPRKSKVTIVGQLGLTRDDRYVLKCAAKVNDKPITTNFVQTYASANDTRKPTNAPHDSYIQTGICHENKYSNLDVKRTKYRMASQATQVNFQQMTNIKSKDFKSQVGQCNFSNAITGNVLNMGNEDNALKECKSPLVIISVYPRHDKEDNIHNSVRIVQYADVPQKQVVSNMEYNISKSQKNKPIKDETISVNKSDQKSFRRRSPSPAPKTFQNKAMSSKPDGKIFDKNNRKSTSTRLRKNNNTSPERLRNKSRDKLSYMTKDGSCDCYCPQNLSKLELLNHPVNLKVGKKHDTKEVKRALVNNFLKSVDRIDRHGRKLLPPKDTSRISINIDGENDRYDVLFEERYFDTGLTIRKTFKNSSQTYSAENEVDDNSMENFLMLSDEIKGTNDAELYTRESRDLSNSFLRKSRLNVKDSLELCYSREGRVGSRLNPTHIRRKYNLRETSFDTDILAPVKHFRGDDCAIPDPNERDKEIRELLGIVRNKRNTKTDVPADTKVNLPENQRQKGCCCRKKCSTEGLMTGLSISKFFGSKSLKRKNKKQRKLNASKQSNKHAYQEANEGTAQAFLNKKQKTDQKSHKVPNASATRSIDKEQSNLTSDSLPAEFQKDDVHKALSQKGNNKTEEKSEKIIKNVSQKEDNSTTEKEVTNNSGEKAAYKETVTSKGRLQNKPDIAPDIIRKEPAREQNLILNRNIQVFLQVEHFTKQRPIILTRKQYDKVKKTIQCTISKNLSVEQRKRCSLRNCNVVSVGEIQIKPRFQYDREVQTERSEIQRNVRCIHIQTPHRCTRQMTKVRNSLKSKMNHAVINKLIYTTNSNNDIDFKTNVNEKLLNTNDELARQTVSSMEIRYANVAYMKHVTISSTQFGDGIHKTINCHKSQKHTNSIHTLFKGPRKCVTPNLGTSAYSLCSDATDACSIIKSVKAPPYTGDSKPKKPFLRRLISCLVMRSAETSMLKEVPVRKPPSLNSSVDSYHISTSLGALEMSSSLYDTSASFYSNHTTHPLNKIKRGFFSSVRGFLTTRRS